MGMDEVEGARVSKDIGRHCRHLRHLHERGSDRRRLHGFAQDGEAAHRNALDDFVPGQAGREFRGDEAGLYAGLYEGARKPQRLQLRPGNVRHHAL